MLQRGEKRDDGGVGEAARLLDEVVDFAHRPECARTSLAVEGDRSRDTRSRPEKQVHDVVVAADTPGRRGR